MIKKSTSLLLLIMFTVIFGYAQEKRVKGKVVSDNQLALSGASVFAKNSNTNAITDDKGAFSLKINQNDTLIVRYIGYDTKRIPVIPGQTVNIILQASIGSLDELVVTGYQKERKKDLTGAVSIVNMDELNKEATANPMKALQGQAAGVFVTSNGSPSSPATIRIRGIGTLNNNDPLFIIDGVPTKAGMHELNSNDIASMQVLKDASAASIYGARAANGVIIITTKHAKQHKLSITANAYTSIQSYTTKPPLLNAGGYGQAYWQSAVNSGRDPNVNNIAYRFNWHVNDKGTPILDKILLPEYIDADRTMKTANTDWFDAISQTGVIQSYKVSVSNGTDQGNYYFSLGYFKNKGIIKTTGFDRMSARMNASYKLFNDKLTIGENFTINGTSEVKDPGVLNLSLQALPIIPIHTDNGRGWGGPVGGMNDRQNPVRLLEDNKQNDYHYIRILGNAFANLELTEGLSFRTNIGLDLGNYLSNNFRKRYHSGYLVNEVNKLQMNYSNTSKVTWTNTFNYVRDLGKNHINAVLGTEFYKAKDNSFWASRTGFAIENPDYTYLDAGTGKKDNGGGAAENVLMSYFGKINYAYNDKYLASFTIRRDGSSRFGENNRFGIFPAFSLGWRLNKENFFEKNISPAFISDLKLRFGWGQTGNQEISNVAAYTIYATDYSGGDPLGGPITSTAYDIKGAGSGLLPSGYRITQRGNKNLKWEASVMSNLGLDFGFMHQKITGSLEFYKKTTNDILIFPPYLAVLGEGGGQWVNGASMENKGVELTLGVNGQLGDLNYKINGNISSNKNKITKLPESVVNNYGGNGLDDNILGRPINSFYGYVAEGLFTSQKQLDNSANQTGKGLGRIRYADLNHDGTIDDQDRTWIGNPHPDFIYGLNISLQYKNFDFSVFLQGVNGIDVTNEVKYNTDFWSVAETGSNKGSRLLDAWSPTNPTSKIPALTTTDANDEARFSTYYVEDGSYLKIRNAQLGYTLPEYLLDKLNLQKVRVYVGGDNLLLLFKSKSFTGLDPESPAYGYPNPMVLTAGINISL